MLRVGPLKVVLQICFCFRDEQVVTIRRSPWIRFHRNTIRTRHASRSSSSQQATDVSPMRKSRPRIHPHRSSAITRWRLLEQTPRTGCPPGRQLKKQAEYCQTKQQFRRADSEKLIFYYSPGVRARLSSSYAPSWFCESPLGCASCHRRAPVQQQTTNIRAGFAFPQVVRRQMRRRGDKLLASISATFLQKKL